MILITGASGFLGSHLMCALVEAGKKVVALKRSKSNLKNSSEIFSFYNLKFENNELIIWEEVELTDYFSIADLFSRYKITEVYHCAGLISYDPKDFELMHQINRDGTAHLVNLSLEFKVERFCHISSVSTMQAGKYEETVTENTKWKSSPKLSGYALSKYAGEREVWRGIQEGLNAVIVNPSIIIGPGCWNTGSGQIISRSKTGFNFYTNGGSGVVDVRDVVKISIELMDKQIFAERFILNSENLSFKEIFSIPNKIFGHSVPNKKISPWLYLLAYHMERIQSVFNGKKPILAKEFLKSGFSISKYSSEKIKTRLNYHFIAALDSFTWACSFFK